MVKYDIINSYFIQGRVKNEYKKNIEYQYIFDLYYANTLRQDMLVWAMASMLGSNNKDHAEDNVIKILEGENDDK